MGNGLPAGRAAADFRNAPGIPVKPGPLFSSGFPETICWYSGQLRLSLGLEKKMSRQIE